MRLLRVAVLLCACLGAAAGHAQGLQERRQALTELKGQIDALKREIAQSEDRREDAADALADAERNISAAQRRLREIQQERRALAAEIERLAAERLRIETELTQQRERLGVTLYRLYVEGDQAGVRRLLSGDDPNQIARDAYYLETLARARRQEIEEARLSLQNLQQVIAQAEARHRELAALEATQAQTHKGLAADRVRQRNALAGAAAQLRAQRREMQTLQRDQTRLSKLLRGLEQISRANAARKLARPTASAPGGGERSTGQAGEVVEPSAAYSAFAALRGKLRWPVRGELVGRFGAQRADGSGVWRGIMIHAGAGEEVRAVAAGRIAFADWLRGFGNLVIVDHGEGYMSVYGNNEALFKSPGQDVKQGETIASVGASGGAEDSGLYFEIRHRGEPQDPQRWMVGR